MADLMARRFAQMGNEPRPMTVSGGIASFEAETTLRLRNCKVTLAPTTIGISAVSVTVCGKNLLDITRCGTGYITNNGQRYTGYDPYEFMDEGYLPVAAGEQLTFSMNQSAAISFALYNPGTKSLNTGATETTGTARTTPVYASDRLIRWSACPKPNAKHGSATDFLAYEPMIEIGGEATAYEAYHGQTYTVELPVTVYGGTVDLAAGKLVSTHSSSGTLLPEPVTYDIPKTDIKPRIGVNNVWSDAGTMEVTYWNMAKSSRLVRVDGVGIANFVTEKPVRLKTLAVSVPYLAGGYEGVVMTHAGKNLFDGVFPYDSQSVLYRQIYVGFKTVTVSSDISQVVNGSSRYSNLFALPGRVSSGAATGTNDVYNGTSRTVTPVDGYISLAYRNWNGVNPATANTMIEVGTQETPFETYDGESVTVAFPETIYGGTIDILSGTVTSEYASDGTILSEPIVYSITSQSINTKSGTNNILINVGGSINLTYLTR